MLLEAKNITKHYANHTALNDVSISIEPQRIFGLLGPNGAGKTSLIRIITQITAADHGSVFFKGQKLEPSHIAQMGYLPEERGLYKKMRVGEQLLYLARLKGISKTEAQKKVRYWVEKFAIEPWWKKNIEELSKGMQQKVQFIATVLHEPELIILDEPFSGFDPINTDLIRKEILRLRENGATIIFSTHRMESVEELCDDIALIYRSKKVLGGKKEDIKNTYKNNTYWIETSKPIDNEDNNEYFNIKETSQQLNGLYKSRVQIISGNINDFLGLLISQENEIHNLKENIPSMNDIFISVVGENSKPNIL